MPNDSIYVTQADKQRLTTMAKRANRKLVGMLRYLMDLHDAIKPSQRAQLLEDGKVRGQGKGE